LKDEKLLDQISKLLKQKNLSIATAESCTGGLIANKLTNISGSSEYFDRGIVSYSNKAKIELLGISEETLKKFGAVSSEVAIEMAKQIKEKSNVDIGLSTTGIAGPTGGTKEKPVGLVYIAISVKGKTIVKEFNFNGNRLENKNSTYNAAMELLLAIIGDK
jgi:nicotinamide-nucleotide amidase